jgi:hypothetical protein
MLQNGRFTGFASTDRNGKCGTYKEEVAGLNPASLTQKNGVLQVIREARTRVGGASGPS